MRVTACCMFRIRNMDNASSSSFSQKKMYERSPVMDWRPIQGVFLPWASCSSAKIWYLSSISNTNIDSQYWSYASFKNKSFMVLWCTCACASVCKAVAQLLDTNPDKGDPYSMSIHAVWCFCSWKLPQQTAQTSRMWQQSYTPRISTLHCILDTQVNCVLCTYIQFTITDIQCLEW